MLNSKLRNELRNLCSMQVEDFANYKWLSQFGNVKIEHTVHGPLIHLERGGDVLAVAHLDTVGNQNARCTIKKNKARCIKLDDRLGVWALLHILDKMPHMPRYDILLTDSEECGQSTAQYFHTDKEYNWLFEFDRAGTDVVMYDYETDGLKDMMHDYGFAVGWGSFTDICSLERLGVAGFNVGTGYHNQHTNQCFADLRDTVDQCEMFSAFAIDMAKTKLAHTQRFNHTDMLVCETCTEWLEQHWHYCPMCGSHVPMSAIKNGLSGLGRDDLIQDYDDEQYREWWRRMCE